MLYQERRRFGAKLCNTVSGSILTMFQRMTPFRQPACTRISSSYRNRGLSTHASFRPRATMSLLRFQVLLSRLFQSEISPLTSYGPYQECFSYRVKKGHFLPFEDTKPQSDIEVKGQFHLIE